MIKKMFIIALTLVFALMFFAACKKEDTSYEPPSITVKTAMNLLENFEFDHTTRGGYELTHIQTVAGVKTHERNVELSLSSGGNKGVFIESVKSLNPNIDGEEYVTSTATYSFNGSEVKKNGAVTNEYTVSDLVSLDLFDVSVIENKLQNLEYKDSTLTFVVPGSCAGVVLGEFSGVDCINVSITTDTECKTITSVSIEYVRNGVCTTVSLIIY